MIAHAHFRRGGEHGREPLAAPGDVQSLAKDYTPSQAFWGKVTSKRPERLSPEDLALQAFRLGVKPATLRSAIESGALDG